MDHDYLLEEIAPDDTNVTVLRMIGTGIGSSAVPIAMGCLRYDEYCEEGQIVHVGDVSFDLYSGEIYSVNLLHNGDVHVVLFPEEF